MTDLADRRRLYLARPLEGLARDLEAAGQGNRNEALNRAAFQLGKLLPLLAWTAGEGEAWLWARAAHLVDRTLTENAARATIRRGLSQGQGKPRDWPLDMQGEAGRFPAQAAPGPRPPLASRPEPPPNYPPAGEVAALWTACLPLDGGGEAPQAWDHDPLTWCRGRGFDPDQLAALDLARLVPDGIALPAWSALGRRTWPAAGFRLVVRAWTAAGELASLHARWTRPGKPPEETPKTLWPAGFQSRGLVLANPAALELLRGERLEACPVVIVEGLTDWLSWGPRALPVFGVTAGSWTLDLAAKVPDGGAVIIRTDNDLAGDKYAAGIVNTFAGRRVELRRKKPAPEGEAP